MNVRPIGEVSARTNSMEIHEFSGTEWFRTEHLSEVKQIWRYCGQRGRGILKEKKDGDGGKRSNVLP